MCTVMLAWNLYHDLPLILAANRDEFHDRPAISPKLHRSETGHPCIAPQDLRRGGTWIGMNEHRMVAAITNRDWSIEGVGKRTRGSIVACALAAPSASEAVAAFTALDPAEFRPFHLIVADTAHAFVLWCDGTALHTNALSPGMHIVTQRDFGASSPIRRVARHFTGLPRDSQALLPALQSALAQHDRQDPYHGTCVHDDDYGTRSSTIIGFGRLGHLFYDYTDGPPCTARWRSVDVPGKEYHEPGWSTGIFCEKPIADPWVLDPTP